jgi:UbiD family decarboxylase
MPSQAIDFDKFRLRSFVKQLADADEIEIHEKPVSLADLSAIIESTPKATLFKSVGPEKYEMVAAVAGSRRRIGLALGVAERDAAAEYMRRLERPQPIVEVASADAPVHQVVYTGEDIDLSRLPFHIQHHYDGCTYISAGIDYTTDPATGQTNVGCRRLMLRDRRTMRSNLTFSTDLKRIYLGCVERGERLPLSFTVGSHPLDFMAASLRLPVDEFGLIATLRGEPVPMVRGITNGVLVPADAEMVIEGYFDELGYRELEGPYGEFWGNYGPVHIDPVFHVTAITMRRDALHQTVFHGGRQMNLTEASNLHSLGAELSYLNILKSANIQPALVHCVPSAQGHARVALRRGAPGRARDVIAALFTHPNVKHVVVVDDDVDIFLDHEIEWAMSTRFRAERDLILQENCEGFYMDPTLEEDRKVTKVGFDATAPYDNADSIVSWRTSPPRVERKPRYQTVQQALESGPMFFVQLMETLGSNDGREIALQLGDLYKGGQVDRLANGEWTLKKSDTDIG